jgi:maltooligosyltrehalose trehalohydrolase
MRREDTVFSRQDSTMLHGAVIGPESIVLRWFDPDADDRLLLVNLGRDYHWHPTAEPLLAPPPEAEWSLLFSSEDTRYGGSGTALPNTKDWTIPGHAAIVLRGASHNGSNITADDAT